jgi:hypothetical protein
MNTAPPSDVRRLTPMDRLELLREELWTRWREAFDKLPDLSHASRSGERVVYANVRLFDLKEYSPHKFPAGGRVLSKLPEGGSSYWVYRLDTEGRPVHMTCRHVFNKIDWQGMYRYADNEVEYVEFCLQTEVVSDYARMTLRDGVPITMQRLDINGGASHLGNIGHRPGKRAIDVITRNPFFYWISVEEYEVADKRIVSGKGMAEGKGISPRRSTREYSYSDSGKLERIVRTDESGLKTTEFAARSRTSTNELAAKLAERIAASVIEALKKVEFDSPLLSVELSYGSVTNYVPALIPITEREFFANPSPVPRMDNKHWLALNGQNFEPEMADFTERLNSAEDWNPGTKMLWRAASEVTKLATHSLPTADCFVVYAIDWEFEGQDLQAILKKCGASAATLKELKRIGWLS